MDGLIRELRTLESTVRAGSTSLGSLLADLRHTHATVGGGVLPLHWAIDEEAAAVALTPMQAVACVRIAEEAMANAIKHARPGSVSVSLEPDDGRDAAVLTIADDGPGHFAERSKGGLSNMRHRAWQAGLGLRFLTRPSGKAVQLRFPAPQRAGSLLHRLVAILERARAPAADDTSGAVPGRPAR